MNKVAYFLLLMTFSMAQASAAGVESQMDKMFNTMTNTTPPTAKISSTKRGVLFGGSYTLKSRVSNPNLISFVPPSFEAGCGGINMFGGSFSFINAAQFQELLRNIAANAAPYAFGLALSSMCSDCLARLETLAQKIQSMNQFLGNSCQMAKGIVDNTLGALLNKDSTEDATQNTSKGIGEIFEQLTRHDANNPTQDAIDAGLTPECKYGANLLWCMMKDNTVTGWWDAGDDLLLQTIMSFTGSYVVTEPVDSDDGEGKQPELIPIPSTSITIDHLVQGGQVPINTCVDGFGKKQCLEVTTATVAIKGLRQRVIDILLGDAVNPGVIHKFNTNSGALTAAEQNFITNAPGGIGSMTRRLAVIAPGGAEAFAIEAAPYVALDLVFQVVDDMLQTARNVQDETTSAFMTEVKDLFLDARQKLSAEKIELRTKYASQDELLAFYTRILQSAQHKRYGLETTTAGIKTTSSTK